MAKHNTEDEEFKIRLKEYKLELKIIYEKSQDAFEKQLSYLSAGALGFSMLFIEKAVGEVSEARLSWTLLFSWILFTITLTANLISHWLAARNMSKSIKEIDDNNYNSDRVNKRISKLNVINVATILTFFLAILSLGIFITTNVMNKNSKPSFEKKGLVPTPAPKHPSSFTSQTPTAAPVKPSTKTK
ncbi:hypothetical protein [Mucilaginibacter segetis]|uniref:Uncharacterized protein n=1 Tax=Mucilaginibacter segetis TaxID=2793071 RepID=A0A934PNZ1_9SPHI|nr:hypothetical protein [Mucilaginibacter segetis]MBK0378063.1 hypothetical protein [Mucilaginibacter segetis]